MRLRSDIRVLVLFEINVVFEETYFYRPFISNNIENFYMFVFELHRLSNRRLLTLTIIKCVYVSVELKPKELANLSC